MHNHICTSSPIKANTDHLLEEEEEEKMEEVEEEEEKQAFRSKGK